MDALLLWVLFSRRLKSLARHQFVNETLNRSIWWACAADTERYKGISSVTRLIWPILRDANAAPGHPREQHPPSKATSQKWRRELVGDMGSSEVTGHWQCCGSENRSLSFYSLRTYIAWMAQRTCLWLFLELANHGRTCEDDIYCTKQKRTFGSGHHKQRSRIKLSFLHSYILLVHLIGQVEI